MSLNEVLAGPYSNPHALGCPWYQVTEQFGAPNLKWCEVTLCSWISEPANTWSNLGYLFVSIYFMWSWRKKTSFIMKCIPFFHLIMGACSFFYHMSNFYISQIFDYIGMYLQLLLLLAINFYRLKIFPKSWILPFNFLGTVLLVGLVHVMYLAHWPYQLIIAVIALILLFSEILNYNKGFGAASYKLYRWAMVCAVLAFSLSILDHERIFCDPSQHLIQGHALWHILGAVMFILIFKFYDGLESEQKLNL